MKNSAPKEKSLMEQAEDYDFTKDLKIGSYLDVKDTASTWCLAQVTKFTTSQITIHYDGWGTKYDEVNPYDLL